MRYLLTIHFNSPLEVSHPLLGEPLSNYLTVYNSYSFGINIKLTTYQYWREKPGLIEQNWSRPFYDNDQYFLFIAGYVLYRENFIQNEVVPYPEEIFNILVKHGDNHYKYLKGNYYLVLYNKISHVIQIYSSPLTLFPAFYTVNRDSFIFTNHPEWFKNFINLEPDYTGILQYILFDHTIHTRTIYKNIYLIQGGYLIQIHNHHIQEKLIYDLAGWYHQKPLPKKEALQAINKTLKGIINRWAAHTDKFNLALTGGFDGRLNLALLEPEHYLKMRLFSYGMPGSRQISIPDKIARALSLYYEPVHLDENFENQYSKIGLETIYITNGITGFNRAVYPYAYQKLSEYSRSCMVGQCDMIRPLYNNPAGIIFNDIIFSVFFGEKDQFIANVDKFKETTILKKFLFDDEIISSVYDEIYKRYINNYYFDDKKITFYFYLLKESITKYWHTEFHVVNIFVDDFASFSDLDYLELLFNSEYAGIYKGIMAKNQLGRRTPHDLYVDLMSLNNNRLNYFYNDRFIKPGWLKFGYPGYFLSIVFKKIGSWLFVGKRNDTFNQPKWSKMFFIENDILITKENYFFITEKMKNLINMNFSETVELYRLERAISLKLWFDKIFI